MAEYTVNAQSTDASGSRGLSVKVNVDVAEAIVGLKAIQREAKKATQALAELKAAQEAVAERGI